MNAKIDKTNLFKKFSMTSEVIEGHILPPLHMPAT